MGERSIREIFPERLLHYMNENGKTKSDLVRDLHFKYSTVRDWEKGITVPRMDKVEMLAKYFQCSNSDLLEEKEKPTEGDGLSEKRRALMQFAMEVPEDNVDMMLRVMKSILQSD